ncbi:hypothetical protein vseg_015987 [Gypsophila vaccaria]
MSPGKKPQLSTDAVGRRPLKIKISSTYLREKRARTSSPNNDGFKVPSTRSQTRSPSIALCTVPCTRSNSTARSASSPPDLSTVRPVKPGSYQGQALNKKRKGSAEIDHSNIVLKNKRAKNLSSNTVEATNISSNSACDTSDVISNTTRVNNSPKESLFPRERVVTFGSVKTINLSENLPKLRRKLHRSAIKHQRKRCKPSVSTPFPSASTRMSPKLFSYAIQCLDTYEQWKAIEDIGFSGVYWLRVSELPMQLGYWILSNYEPAKNSLILPGGQELHLRAVDVHATLGIPMGPKEVKLARSLNDSDEFSDFYRSWRDQFEQQSGLISNKTLAEHLVKQEDGCDLFKINWVVLVVSLLIQNNQKPNANFHVLKSLMSVNEIPTYNWCEFVLKSLRVCQRAWIKSKKNSYVTGPLLILMLVYADRVVHETR